MEIFEADQQILPKQVPYGLNFRFLNQTQYRKLSILLQPISLNDSVLIRDIKMKLAELEDRIIGSNDLVFEGVVEEVKYLLSKYLTPFNFRPPLIFPKPLYNSKQKRKIIIYIPQESKKLLSL